MKNSITAIVVLACAAIMQSCTVTTRNASRAVVSVAKTNFRTIENIDSLKKADQVDLASLQAKYPDDPAVYLNYDELLESEGYLTTDYDKSSYTHYSRYVVLRGRYDELSQFVHTTRGPEKLTNLYAIVLAPDGTVEKYELNDCMKQYATGKTTYRLHYIHAVPGSVVEVGYRIEFSLRHSYELQISNMPIEKLKFRHIFPQGMNLITRSNAKLKLSDFIEKKSQNGDDLERIYERENVPAFHDESYMPNGFVDRPMYEYASVSSALASDIEKMRLNPAKNYEPCLSPDLDDRWMHQVSEFILTGRQYTSMQSAKSDDFARSLCKGMKSKAAMIDTICTWVQSHIECIHKTDSREDRVGRFDDFAQMQSEGFGTEPYVLALTQSMLIAVGVDADLAIPEDQRQNCIDELVPEIFHYPDIALLCRDGSSSYLIFPQDRDVPPDFVPDHFRGSRALIIGGFKNGTSSKNTSHHFESLWCENMKSQATVVDYDLKIADDGSVVVKADFSLRGCDASSHRRRLQKLKGEDRERYIRGWITARDYLANVQSSNVVSLGNLAEPLRLHLEYSANSPVAKVGPEAILQTVGLFAQNSVLHSSAENTKREHPITISDEASIRKNILIHYPASWKLSVTPTPVELKNSFGAVSLSYDTSVRSELAITVSWQIHRGSQPKEKLPELLQLVGGRCLDQVPALVFATQ